MVDLGGESRDGLDPGARAGRGVVGVRSPRMDRCPRCDAPAIEIQRREELGLGSCRRCQLVFDLSQAPAARTLPKRWSAPASKVATVPSPDGFEVVATRAGSFAYRDAGGRPDVRIVRDWWTTKPLLGSPPVAIAGGILMLIVTPLLFTASPKGRGGAILGPELGIVMCVVTLIYFYALACMRWNRTTMTVRAGHLDVQHGPLPWWPGSRSFAAGDVEQLYVEEKIVEPRRRERGLRVHVGGDDLDRQISYEVRALVGGQVDAWTLASHLQTPEEALFLESTLEESLGLVDRPVAGELPIKRGWLRRQALGPKRGS